MTSKSFPCVACPTQIFESRAKLSRHYSEAHKNGKIPCPQCKVEISTMSKLRKHIKIHEPNRSRGFKCTATQCDKNFHTTIGVKLHFARAHATERPFPCPLQCGKMFKTKQDVKSHILSHTKEKPHKCDQCDGTFFNKSSLQRHTQFQHTNSGEKPQGCDHCGIKFNCRYNLERHILSMHTARTKDFFCSGCPSKFFTKCELIRHSVAHESERKLVDCYFCSKKLTRQSSMENHLRIHTTEQPFICPEKSCTYSSTQESTLRRHVEHIHQKSADIMKYACYFCVSKFNHINGITYHMRTHTMEEPFSCKLCKKSFKASSNVKQHIHRFHTKEKPHKCDQCEKCFSSSEELKGHATRHSGEKRFFCKICSYASYNSGDLKKHNKTRHKITKYI